MLWIYTQIQELSYLYINILNQQCLQNNQLSIRFTKSMQSQKKVITINLHYHGIQSIVHVDTKSTLANLKQNFLYYRTKSQLTQFYFRYFPESQHGLLAQNICISQLSSFSLILKKDISTQNIFTKEYLIKLMKLDHLIATTQSLDVQPLSVDQVEKSENLYEILAMGQILQNPLILDGFNQNVIIEQNQLKFILKKLNLKISESVQMKEYRVYWNMEYKNLQVDEQLINKEMQKWSHYINILEWITKFNKINDKIFEEIIKLPRKQWLINMLTRINHFRSLIHINKLQIDLKISQNLEASINLINKFNLSFLYKKQQQIQYINQLTYKVVQYQLFKGEIDLTTQQISNLRNNPFCNIQNLCKQNIDFCLNQICKSKQAAIANSTHANNSITFLAMHKYIFQNLDFQYIKINGADISGAVFTNVNFKDSKLSNCIARGTIFQGCPFKEASISNFQSSQFFYQLSRKQYYNNKYSLYKGQLYVLGDKYISVFSLQTKKTVRMIYLNIDDVSEFKVSDNYIVIFRRQKSIICNHHGQKLKQIHMSSNVGLRVYNKNSLLLIGKSNCLIYHFEKMQQIQYQILYAQNLYKYKYTIAYHDENLFIGHENTIIIKYKSKTQSINFPQLVQGFFIQGDRIYCVSKQMVSIYNLTTKKLQDPINLELQERIYHLQMFESRYLQIGFYQNSIIVDLNQRLVYKFFCELIYIWNHKVYNIQNKYFAKKQILKFSQIQLSKFNLYRPKGLNLEPQFRFFQNKSVNAIISKQKIIYKILNKNPKELKIYTQKNSVFPVIAHNETLNILAIVDQLYFYILDINAENHLVCQFNYKSYIQNYDSEKKFGNQCDIKKLRSLMFDKKQNLHLTFTSIAIIFKYPEYNLTSIIEFKQYLYRDKLFLIGDQHRESFFLHNTNNNIKIYNNQYKVNHVFKSYFLNINQNDYQQYDQVNRIYTLDTNSLTIKFTCILQNSIVHNLLKNIQLCSVYQNQVIYLDSQNQLVFSQNIYQNHHLVLNKQSQIQIRYMKILQNQIYCIGYIQEQLVLHVYDKSDGKYLTEFKFKQFSSEIYSITILEQTIFLANMDKQLYCFQIEEGPNLTLSKLQFNANIKQVSYYNQNYIFLDNFSHYCVYDKKLQTKKFEKCQKKRIVNFCGATNNQKYIYQFSNYFLEIFNCQSLEFKSYELPFPCLIKNVRVDDTGQHVVILYKKMLLVVVDLKNNKIIRKIIVQNLKSYEIDTKGFIHTINIQPNTNFTQIIYYEKSLYQKDDKIEPEEIQQLLYKYKLSHWQLIQIKTKNKNDGISVWNCKLDKSQKYGLKQFNEY